jgi:hypothetical protein
MTAIERWLAAAEADADRRSLPELKPLLQALAASTAVLRAAEWNERADAPAAAAAVGRGSETEES